MGKETSKQYKFEIGDWSADGHGMYESIMISTRNTECLEADYQKGFEKTGLDITKYCEDYGDSDLPRSFIEDLEKAGFDIMDIDDIRYCKENPLQDNGKSYTIYYHEYLDIWMFIAKKGNPDLEWEECKYEGTVQPGGYGLFSH